MATFTDMPAWLALGSALQQLALISKQDLQSACVDSLNQILECMGLGENDPVRVQLEQFDWATACLALDMGSLGSWTRELLLKNQLVQDMLGSWQTEHDAIEYTEDPWPGFLDDLLELRPEPPVQAIQRMWGLERELTLMDSVDMTFWPLVLSEESSSELVSQALEQLAERTSLDRKSLALGPEPPAALPEPAMTATEAYNALVEVHDWLEALERWARVLGRLAPLLPKHCGFPKREVVS